MLLHILDLLTSLVLMLLHVLIFSLNWLASGLYFSSLNILLLPCTFCATLCRVFVDFQMGCKSVTNPSMSSVSSQLNVPSWEVKYAPAPENIFW